MHGKAQSSVCNPQQEVGACRPNKKEDGEGKYCAFWEQGKEWEHCGRSC